MFLIIILIFSYALYSIYCETDNFTTTPTGPSTTNTPSPNQSVSDLPQFDASGAFLNNGLASSFVPGTNKIIIASTKKQVMAKALALAGFFYEDVGLMKSKKGGLAIHL